MSKGAQIALGAVVIAVLIGWYASATLKSGASFRYFQTLDEFRTAPAATGAPVRVHGFVTPGSIDRSVEAKAVRFSVQNDPPHAAGRQAGLAVSYATLELPDMFKDGAEVVIEGRIEGEGDAAVFHATNVLAKCPSKFQAKTADAAAR